MIEFVEQRGQRLVIGCTVADAGQHHPGMHGDRAALASAAYTGQPIVALSRSHSPIAQYIGS